MHESAEEVTQILDAVSAGDTPAAEKLLPLVYEELRKLAAHRMAREAPGQTLQPTALVHEAWLRLTGFLRRTFWPSIVLAAILGLLVYAQAYWLTWMVP